MTARMIKTREVPRSDYGIYLGRAREFHEDMHSTSVAGHWGTAGLLAVHSVIALCDALLVLKEGKRSAGEDHHHAVDLFSRLAIDGAGAQAANLGRIIAKKNAVAYENREFRKAEALDIIKQADRFFQWALKYFPSVAG